MSDVPEKLGKYQIRRAIGKGAMGIVYEGFDPIIDRVVAIKTIKKDELDKEEAEEHSRRFLIEAKAAGRLNHKNIVGIYDYGEERGLSFIVMEFVQGKELKSFFNAKHPFSMSQIVRLMGELLDALGYSHSRGVIHRDVKPDNIFVTDDGSVKLGDFGIARIDSTQKTHAGTVLGTPSYMAPEQIRGETADARSDLYAAGVILYQFLVGERPFSGGMVQVMQKVLMEAPKPPSSHNPSIPEAIDAVVLRALAKQADQRFANAAEFSRELTAAVGLASEDEGESTMIMSADALKALQDAALAPADRTGTHGTQGTGSTRTGSTQTGTGTGTGGRTAGSAGGAAGG
ncbi:MAG TPA: serine/threonine-protein kinase, partial [Burkholderiaceae bacterium]